MNILRAVQLAALERHHATVLARITADLNLNDPLPERPTTGRTPAGDERRLRGIPVVGARGIGGAIPGSRPGANL